MNHDSITQSLTSAAHAQPARPLRWGAAFSARQALRSWALQPLRPAARHDDRTLPVVRRVRAGDAEAFQAFITGLSPVSRRMRFHGAVNACSPALLQYLTQTDNPQHQVWLAWQDVDGQARVVGEARFVVSGDPAQAEFAIAVADEQRGSGVADRLLRTLIDGAAQCGITSLYGDVLEDNARMFGFLRRHGFALDPRAGVDPGVLRWRRRLGAAPRPACTPARTAAAGHGLNRCPVGAN